MVIVIDLYFSLVYGGLIVFSIKLYGRPYALRMTAALSLMTLAYAIIIWILARCNPRRSSGYEWEDWKLREDQS